MYVRIAVSKAQNISQAVSMIQSTISRLIGFISAISTRMQPIPVNLWSYGSPLDDDGETFPIVVSRLALVDNAFFKIMGSLIANAPVFVYLPLSSFYLSWHTKHIVIYYPGQRSLFSEMLVSIQSCLSA